MSDDLNGALADLEKAETEIERLKAENAKLREWKVLDKPLTAAMGIANHEIKKMKAEIKLLQAENQRLEIELGNVGLVKEEIERLRDENEQHCGAVAAWRRLKAEIERLRVALKDCADDLENELRARYKDTLSYPSQKRRFERDMEPVIVARTLLKPTPPLQKAP